MVVGGDIYTTDPQLIKKGIKEKTTNAVLIKLNQIGTVLETVEAVKLAQGNGWGGGDFSSHRRDRGFIYCRFCLWGGGGFYQKRLNVSFRKISKV